MSRSKKKLIGNQKRLDMNRNGRLDSQDFKILRATKESYSNWRSELPEVMEHIANKNPTKITEKKVNNQVAINPRSQDPTDRHDTNTSIGESVKNLGATLLEVTEYPIPEILSETSNLDLLLIDSDLLEEIVCDFVEEALEEGYEIQEIEEGILSSIEYSLSILHEDSENSRRIMVLTEIKQLIKNIAKGLIRGVGYVRGLKHRVQDFGARQHDIGYTAGRGGSYSYRPSSRYDDDDDDDDDDYRPRATRARARTGDGGSRRERVSQAIDGGLRGAVSGPRITGDVPPTPVERARRVYNQAYERGRYGATRGTPAPTTSGTARVTHGAGTSASERVTQGATPPPTPTRRPTVTQGAGSSASPSSASGQSSSTQGFQAPTGSQSPQATSTTIPAPRGRRGRRQSRSQRIANLGRQTRSQRLASAADDVLSQIRNEPTNESKNHESLVNQILASESAPPGFKGTVEAMKKYKDIDNPFALAWWMKKRGYKSHKKSKKQMKEAAVTAPLNPTTTKPTAQQIQNPQQQAANSALIAAQKAQSTRELALAAAKAKTAQAQRKAAQSGEILPG